MSNYIPEIIYGTQHAEPKFHPNPRQPMSRKHKLRIQRRNKKLEEI